MERGKYIVIDGIIGVGKTSLSKLLAKEIKAQLLLEPIEDNPFLAKFYKNKKKYAFQTQIFFLLSRFQQQQEIKQYNLFEENIVADYFFAKDRIFAYQNLEESELILYEKLYSLISPQIPIPQLVIYLQTTSEIAMERIKLRQYPYEKHIKKEYIETLNKAYNHFFFHYNDSPLLVVNTNNIDFVNNKEDLHNLIEEIKNIQPGTRWYISG